MGMFDKDKQFGNRLDQEFEVNVNFILWDADISDEAISTSFGMATVANLLVSRMETPEDAYVVTTVASAIVDKIKEKEDGDLPAVVKTRRVASSRSKKQEAFVLQFVKPYTGDVTPVEAIEAFNSEDE